MTRHTKIIATLGPAVASSEAVRKLVEAGMDAARLNFSHGDQEFHRMAAGWVRQAARETGRTVALIQDIQGPKLRLGSFNGGAMKLVTGQEVRLVSGETGEAGAIPVGYEHLLQDILPGHEVVMADGLIRCEVVSAEGQHLVANVTTGGTLSNHKGVAFPDSSLSLDNLTEKDETDLAFGRELGVEYVAASFVRTRRDVEAVAALADVPVIAKIELAQALENLDEIIQASFGIMVARGDLGVQLPLEKIPLIQAEILKRTNEAGRISITATEMLESMTHSPRPTRAEVTDVANAVMAGSDAVMLSGETAVGEFPAETIRAMARICNSVEEDTLSGRGDMPVSFVGDNNVVASAVSQAATQVAVNVNASVIVAFTESGNTARLLSKYRPESEIVAFSPNVTTLRRMALYWGVSPLEFQRETYTDEEIKSAAVILQEAGMVKVGERIVMVAGVPPNVKASTNLLKVHVVGELSGGLGS